MPASTIRATTTPAISYRVLWRRTQFDINGRYSAVQRVIDVAVQTSLNEAACDMQKYSTIDGKIAPSISV